MLSTQTLTALVLSFASSPAVQPQATERRPAGMLELALWIGADPEALAAADVGAPEATRVLEVLAQTPAERIGDLRRTLADLGHQRSALIESLRLDPTDQALRETLVQTEQRVGAAEAASAKARQELAEVALAPLSGDQRQRLATIAAAPTFRVPVEWRAAGANADWDAARTAATAERRAERRGQASAPETALTQMRANPGVAQARLFFRGRIQELRTLFASLRLGS